MRQLPLGQTGLTVPDLCLGTMTWGSQTPAADAHAQGDIAMEHGLTFWDTAEVYPVNPIRAETAGHSEAIIGDWLALRGGRDRLVLATKVTGAGQTAVRDGAPITGAILRTALEGSLRRLRTDYIDLYQLHWPNRGHYHFRNLWRYDPSGVNREQVTANMLDVLETARDLIAEGKIRHLGLSNETVWGAARWLHLAETLGLPRMMTVQNEYSLLCRQFDTDWAEMAVAEQMPLLAFSPLAAGLLTGKYAGDVVPEATRRFFSPQLGGRITPQVFPAVAAYLAIAARHGIDPVHLALAFCRSRPFPIIPIFGATTTAQLRHVLVGSALTLPAEVLSAIAAAHRVHPQPY